MDFVLRDHVALFAAAGDSDMYAGAAFAFLLFVVIAVGVWLLVRRKRSRDMSTFIQQCMEVDDLFNHNPEEFKRCLAAEAEAYFARFGSITGESETKMTAMDGVTVMDLTSAKEKRIEQEAKAEVWVGPCFWRLVGDLRVIRSNFEFTIVPENPVWGSDDYEGRAHKGARAVGCMLDACGGMDLMQAAWYRIKAEEAYEKANGIYEAKGDAKDLSRCWDGIGKWQY